MRHLRRLLKGAHSTEEEPFAFLFLLFLVYKTNLMVGILAAILEHEVNLRMKSHEMGGVWVPDDTKTMEPPHQHCLSSDFFYMRKNKLQSCLNHSEFY